MNSSTSLMPRLCRSIAVFSLAVLCHVAHGAEPAAWPVIEQQGLVRSVLVPSALASDDAAYRKQISRLCPPDRTCFLNFYTNSKGVALAVPLPDAIANEATATYRRSMKNGVEILMWSCRMKVPGADCF
jgi:hypothetical protein